MTFISVLLQLLKATRISETLLSIKWCTYNKMLAWVYRYR